MEEHANRTEIYGASESPMHQSDSSKRSKFAFKLSSAAIEAYCQYEALDYSEKPQDLWKFFLALNKQKLQNPTSQVPTLQYHKSGNVFPRFEYGIFFFPLEEPDLPGRLLAVYIFIMRWASINWRYCIRWILVFVSRRVSGISKAEDVTLTTLLSDGVMHKCSGYYGWGKIALLLDADAVCERLRSELTNLSIISALFLTFTVPLMTIPPDAIIMQYTNESSIEWLDPAIIQSFYVIACGGSVACQLATVTTAISMITNLNKCQATSGETGVVFIKSIFNPYNGLTGTIGPAMYIGSLASWMCTMCVTIITCAATYNNPVDIWAWHFILVALVFFVFLLQLSLGIMAEFHAMTPEMNRFAADPQKHMDEVKENKEK
eukprot:gene35373-45817_t